MLRGFGLATTTFCQISFSPLFTHLSDVVPDLARAPIFVHLLPGVLGAATLRGNEKKMRLEVRARTMSEIRRMAKRVHPHFRKF